MTDIWKYLKEQNRPILLYGMGNGAEKVITALERYSLKPTGVFAGKGHTKVKEFYSMPVTSFSAAKQKYPDMIALLCFGTSLKEVMNEIIEIGKECELYIVDVPVYGSILFNSEFYSENLNFFENFKKLPSDELSKKTLDNYINFKLSGKPEYLLKDTVTIDELYDFLQLENDKVYVDLGAYNGDTVELFLSKNNNYEKIYAVEPDTKTFAKLLKNTQMHRDIEYINACAGSFDGEVGFNMSGSRGSKIKDSEALIKQITVDSLLNGEKADFIKFDIEGNELEAIKGATKTIKAHTPKMLMAAYHKSDDLLTLPKAVLEINDNYDIYLRRNPCFPFWDFNLIFMPKRGL